MQRTVGTFDGTKVTLARSVAKNHDVAVHEAVHEKIFYETFDGTLHHLVIMGQATLGRGIAADYSRFLMNDTREAHEAAATYLGIQSLDTDQERATAKARFPTRYRHYYQLLDDLILPLTSSSYLSYSLGWALSHWAFNSTRLFHVYDKGWSAFDGLKAIPSPTMRLREALSRLKGETARQWRDEGLERAQQGMRDLGFELWDHDNDQEWENRPREQAGRFEALLTSALSRSARNTFPLATAEWDKLPPGLEEWMIRFLEESGIEAWTVLRGPGFEFDPDRRIERAKLLLERYGKSIFSNDARADLEPLPSRTPEEMAAAFARLASAAPAVYCVAAASHDGSGPWAINVYGGDRTADSATAERGRSATYEVDRGFAWIFIAHLRQNQDANAKRACLLLAPLSWAVMGEALADLATITKVPIERAGIVERLRTEFERHYPVWYWGDDWSDIYRFRDVEAFSALIEMAGTKLDEAYTVHLAKTPQLPGYIMCLKSRVSGTGIAEYEKAMIEAGELTAMADQEALEVIESTKGHVAIMLDTWKQF